MSRRYHLTDEDRARIAENDACCRENGRELLLNVRSGKAPGSGFLATRQRQIDFAVIRWQKNKSNFNFVTGGNFNSVAGAMKKAA